jgi:class 3 adenylate cyclase
MSPEKRTPIPLPIQWEKTSGVILFADLAGFFPIAGKMSLDQLGRFMQQFYEICHAEVLYRKGEVVTFVGDSVLGFYRSEACAGMDPEWCAALTAFHLVKQLKRLDPQVPINVGLNSGEVLEGTWVMNQNPTRTIMGETVNQAAILAGGKLPGIHASKSVTEVLGPRVTHEKTKICFPGGKTETVFRLLSLDL